MNMFSCCRPQPDFIYNVRFEERGGGGVHILKPSDLLGFIVVALEGGLGASAIKTRGKWRIR